MTRVVLDCPEDLMEWALHQIQGGQMIEACPTNTGGHYYTWGSAKPEIQTRVSRLKDGGVKVRVERREVLDASQT